MPSVQWIIRVTREVYVAVRARKHGLVFPAALRVEACLQTVRSYDLRDIVDEVEGVILVDEWQAVEIGKRERIVGDSAVTEVRNITRSDVRKEFRHIDIVDAGQ